MHDDQLNGYGDPARTLELLNQLKPLGFSDKVFAIIHHFEKAQTIKSHRQYCEKLINRAAPFRTRSNNRIVQWRLEMLLNRYQSASSSTKSPALFQHLANAALLEVPHPPRI